MNLKWGEMIERRLKLRIFLAKGEKNAKKFVETKDTSKYNFLSKLAQEDASFTLLNFEPSHIDVPMKRDLHNEYNYFNTYSFF